MTAATSSAQPRKVLNDDEIICWDIPIYTAIAHVPFTFPEGDTVQIALYDLADLTGTGHENIWDDGDSLCPACLDWRLTNLWLDTIEYGGYHYTVMFCEEAQAWFALVN